VEIDPPTVGRPQHGPGREVVFDQIEGQSFERRDDVGNRRQFDDEIDVFVVTGLPAEEGVDAPTAIEPDLETAGAECVEDLEDLGSLHHTFLSHWRSPGAGRIRADEADCARYACPVVLEQEMVQLFACKARQVEAMQGLVGGVTATHLRTAVLSPAAFDAVIEGLSDPNPRVRWWCVQVLDHVPDDRSIVAIAGVLDDPVARVRRNAAHALGCVACKPVWENQLPAEVASKLARTASSDSNQKVRLEAQTALSCGGGPAAD
jgi:HEAT repeats